MIMQARTGLQDSERGALFFADVHLVPKRFDLFAFLADKERHVFGARGVHAIELGLVPGDASLTEPFPGLDELFLLCLRDPELRQETSVKPSTNPSGVPHPVPERADLVIELLDPLFSVRPLRFEVGPSARSPTKVFVGCEHLLWLAPPRRRDLAVDLKGRAFDAEMCEDEVVKVGKVRGRHVGGGSRIESKQSGGVRRRRSRAERRGDPEVAPDVEDLLKM